VGDQARRLQVYTKKMAKQLKVINYKKVKTKRKGVHSKSKSSLLKASKNYKKKYRGQGKSR